MQANNLGEKRLLHQVNKTTCFALSCHKFLSLFLCQQLLLPFRSSYFYSQSKQTFEKESLLILTRNVCCHPRKFQFLKGKVLRCFVVAVQLPGFYPGVVFPFCLSSAIEPCKVMHGFGNVCLAWFAGMILIRSNVYEAASLAMANKYF